MFLSNCIFLFHVLLVFLLTFLTNWFFLQGKEKINLFADSFIPLTFALIFNTFRYFFIFKFNVIFHISIKISFRVEVSLRLFSFFLITPMTKRYQRFWIGLNKIVLVTNFYQNTCGIIFQIELRYYFVLWKSALYGRSGQVFQNIQVKNAKHWQFHYPNIHDHWFGSIKHPLLTSLH